MSNALSVILLLNQTPTYTISNMWLSRPQVINHSKEETQ
jgi:hypothetical protein